MITRDDFDFESDLPGEILDGETLDFDDEVFDEAEEALKRVRMLPSLTEFLDEHGLLKSDQNGSRSIWWPLPGAGASREGPYLEIYVRNFAYGEEHDAFTLARLETVGIKARPYRRQDGYLHGTGAFRALLAELERILPLYGYTKIVVESVGNKLLAQVLERYGFERFDGNSYRRQIKDLSCLAPNQEAISRKKQAQAARNKSSPFDESD